MFKTAKTDKGKDKLMQRQKNTRRGQGQKRKARTRTNTKGTDNNTKQGQRQTISVEVVENGHASLFISSLAVFSVIGLGDPVPGR